LSEKNVKQCFFNWNVVRLFNTLDCTVHSVSYTTLLQLSIESIFKTLKKVANREVLTKEST